MRKFLITILALAVLVSALVITASASEFEESAGKLNELGLFQGSNLGFELDRAPNRAEAVTMLVRFLGLEEEALEGDYSHPFTDVPDWASSYVAIAYEMGYTTGVTETTFNPTGTCSAQMYATFILRALGYSDDSVQSDLWTEAISFGKEVGIIDDVILADAFLRGNMTAVSYLALSVAPADGEYDTLLEKLAADGAVDNAKAAAMLELFKLIGEFAEVNAKAAKETNIAMSMVMNMEMTYMGETTPATVNYDIAVIVEDDDIELAMAMDASIPGEEDTVMEMYITGGTLYMGSDDAKIKLPLTESMGVSFDDLIAMADVGGVSDMSEYPLYMVKSLTKGSQDGLTVYTVELSGDTMTAMIEQIFAMLGSGLGLDVFDGVSIGDFTMSYCIDDDGELKKLGISMDMSMDVEGSQMSMKAKIESEIIAVGDNVEVNFPDDLDSYLTLDELFALMAEDGETE